LNVSILADRSIGPARSVDRDLRALIWLVVVVIACGLSLFLSWRRIAGALVQPPSAIGLVIAAVGLAVAATLLRRVWPVRSRGSEPTRGRSAPPSATDVDLPFAFPGIAAILMLAALTLPGTSVVGVIAAWLVLFGCEAASWLWHRRMAVVEIERTRPLLVESPEARSIDADEEPAIPAGLVQQVTRVREADRESIHALVRAEIPAGDRLAAVHLAFCPPLANSPKLTAHAMETGDDSIVQSTEVRITQAESFGARIEVRLPRAVDQPQCVLVEVLGSVTVPKPV
jgi:hypothetical protein